MELKNIKSGSKLLITESTDIRGYDRKILQDIIGGSINFLSFPYNVHLDVDDFSTKISTQQLIISTEKADIKVSNHYHESVYNTGLKYLIIIKNRNPRPHNSVLKMTNFNQKISNIEVWGVKAEEIPWDDDKINLYKEKQVLTHDIEEVEHKIDLRFILRFTLENGNMIVVRADMPNNLFVDLYPKSETTDISILDQDFHLWETIV